jgi:hypothetical protein
MVSSAGNRACESSMCRRFCPFVSGPPRVRATGLAAGVVYVPTDKGYPDDGLSAPRVLEVMVRMWRRMLGQVAKTWVHSVGGELGGSLILSDLLRPPVPSEPTEARGE